MTESQKRLEALANMSDDDIDFSDIPESTDFSKGWFPNQEKEPYTVHLSLDVIKVLQAQGKADSVHVNEILRSVVIG